MLNLRTFYLHLHTIGIIYLLYDGKYTKNYFQNYNILIHILPY